MDYTLISRIGFMAKWYSGYNITSLEVCAHPVYPCYNLVARTKSHLFLKSELEYSLDEGWILWPASVCTE